MSVKSSSVSLVIVPSLLYRWVPVNLSVFFQLLEPSLPQLVECLSLSGTSLATLQIFVELCAWRPHPFSEHINRLKSIVEQQPHCLAFALQVNRAALIYLSPTPSSCPPSPPSSHPSSSALSLPSSSPPPSEHISTGYLPFLTFSSSTSHKSTKEFVSLILISEDKNNGHVSPYPKKFQVNFCVYGLVQFPFIWMY